jgi:hypothetical protein
MREESFEIVLLGGVLTADGPVRDRVLATLKVDAPNASVIRPRHDAAFGAALLARDLGRKTCGKKSSSTLTTS